MFVQMLLGERFNPYMFLDDNKQSNQTQTFIQHLNSRSDISREAYSIAVGLLDEDPEKRLGSPNSPYGSIRDHSFFKSGNQVDWQQIDEGSLKPFCSDSKVVEKEKKREQFISDHSYFSFRICMFHLINLLNLLMRYCQVYH